MTKLSVCALEVKVENVDYVVGDRVKIISGPLNDFEGVILDLKPESQKAKVKVEMFNTETEVEVDYVQLEKVK